jgi:hypothetical protein
VRQAAAHTTPIRRAGSRGGSGGALPKRDRPACRVHGPRDDAGGGGSAPDHREPQLEPDDVAARHRRGNGAAAISGCRPAELPGCDGKERLDDRKRGFRDGPSAGLRSTSRTRLLLPGEQDRGQPHLDPRGPTDAAQRPAAGVHVEIEGLMLTAVKVRQIGCQSSRPSARSLCAVDLEREAPTVTGSKTVDRATGLTRLHAKPACPRRPKPCRDRCARVRRNMTA